MNLTFAENNCAVIPCKTTWCNREFSTEFPFFVELLDVVEGAFKNNFSGVSSSSVNSRKTLSNDGGEPSGGGIEYSKLSS